MAAPLWESLVRLWGGIAGGGIFRRTPISLPPKDAKTEERSQVVQYRALWAMYENNSLYDQLSELLARQNLWKESLKPLRNPANRIVEFHASKLWPGANLDEALPLQDASAGVERAIKQMWTWGNFAAQKQVYARWLPAYGDLFVKVNARTLPEPRVYWQKLEPETCSHVEHDERGYITHLRIDVPLLRDLDPRNGVIGGARVYWRTEIWDKPSGSIRIWEHDRGVEATPRDMGQPIFQETLEDAFGIDFIPIVQIQWKDVGADRGRGAYAHAFDKIHEANRVATRLHAMAFRHSNVDIVLTAGGVDANMIPLPPPEAEDDDGNSFDDGTALVGDDRVWRMGGNGDVKFLVPNLPYGELVEVLKNHMAEIEDDCPEMAYYHMREFGNDLSGRAVRIMLSDAVDRALEGRGNGEQGLIRLCQMGLTIGQQVGAFPGLGGSFEEGSFDFTFKERPIIPTNDLEDAQAEQTQAQAKLAKSQLGIPDEVLQKEMGYTDEEIVEMAGLMEEQRNAAIERQQQQFAAGNVDLNPRGGGQNGNGGAGGGDDGQQGAGRRNGRARAGAARG